MTESGYYTRRVLYKEGDALPDGRVVEIGALYLRNERVRVMLDGSYDKIVGSASSLQRDDDGTVSVLFHCPEWFFTPDNALSLDDFDYGFFMDQLELDEKRERFRKVRIAAIYLMPKTKMKDQDD